MHLSTTFQIPFFHIGMPCVSQPPTAYTGARNIDSNRRSTTYAFACGIACVVSYLTLRSGLYVRALMRHTISLCHVGKKIILPEQQKLKQIAVSRVAP